MEARVCGNADSPSDNHMAASSKGALFVDPHLIGTHALGRHTFWMVEMVGLHSTPDKTNEVEDVALQLPRGSGNIEPTS